MIMKKVLILGAGLVAKPIIEYLLQQGYKITVASPLKERADEMINHHPNGSSVYWSMDDREVLGTMISANDITVSLLPYKFHADVASICIQFKKALVTTSYVQPEMQALDEDAKKAGIILLNEIGLDPGIDHMSAMKIIDRIHKNGGKVDEFWSLCGALPAPEAVNNPFGYKFSWSPKGVILASRNSALYLKKGKQVFVPPADLFKDRFEVEFPGVGILEAYPNRDSVSYKDIYCIPEARTVYRGTLRFKGWCEILDFMKSINMLDDTVIDYSGKTYRDFIAERTGLKSNDIKKDLCKKAGVEPDSIAPEALEWLGLFEEKNMNASRTTPFEITSDLMISKMSLAGNERDMVVLQHIFHVIYGEGRKETIRSTMLDFGTPATNTSIARTVALPAAIAVTLIMEKKINLTGVQRPVVPEIYEPVLAGLEKLGIRMTEETEEV
jgi:saccharopine dehydrogenase (NADP+, L-glutamate forming)